MTRDELLKAIEDAGVVGCGGAGFPTHIKLGAKAHWLIINGAECEPFLQTDKYIMRHFAKKLVSAAARCGELVGAKRLVFALKEHYAREAEALGRAITDSGEACELFLLKNFYPAGDEQVLVREVTGNIVMPGGIPLSVDAVVINVGTVLNIYNAMNGEKVNRKLLTVTGAVKRPVIIDAPLGCPLEKCLEAAGEVIDDNSHYILGGPMMGDRVTGAQLKGLTVTKTGGAIIKLPDDYISNNENIDIRKMLSRAKSACIQCRSCTDLCPRQLMGHPIEPHKIMRRLSMAEDIEEMLGLPDVINALICCECGCCEVFACPMGLMPRTINAMLKKEYAARGIRYKYSGEKPEDMPFREARRIPPRSLAARLGLAGYFDIQIDECVSIED